MMTATGIIPVAVLLSSYLFVQETGWSHKTRDNRSGQRFFDGLGELVGTGGTAAGAVVST